jgi:hypothetical protein
VTDYVKSTSFASKDALASGNPLKIVKGTEIDIEFNNIAAAIATKSNGIDTALTGVPTAPTAAAGTNTSQIATTAFVTTALQSLYPVGSIYINAGVSTNPATLLGFGTWAAFGAGRVMVGLNGGDALFDTLEETGGSKNTVVVSHTHTGTTSTTGSHNHSTSANGNTNGYAYGGDAYNVTRGGLDGGPYTSMVTGTAGSHNHTFTTDSAGSSGTNANLQPYITVAMWKRTA